MVGGFVWGRTPPPPLEPTAPPMTSHNYAEGKR